MYTTYHWEKAKNLQRLESVFLGFLFFSQEQSFHIPRSYKLSIYIIYFHCSITTTNNNPDGINTVLMKGIGRYIAV